MQTQAEEAMTLLEQVGEHALAAFITENRAPVNEPAHRTGAVIVLADHTAVQETPTGCRFIWMENGLPRLEDRDLATPLRENVGPAAGGQQGMPRLAQPDLGGATPPAGRRKRNR